MMVTFVSQCEHKALNRTRRVLDAFANRIGTNTWQTVMTEDGLEAVKKLLRKTATKNTAVSCHWIRSRSRSEFLWVVGSKDEFNAQGIVPVNYTNQINALKMDEIDVNIENYYANTKKQPLDQHLFAVGYTAYKVIKKFNLEEGDKLAKATFIAGCWHDVGKVDNGFQEWLLTEFKKKDAFALEIPDDGQHNPKKTGKWSAKEHPRHNEISLLLFFLLNQQEFSNPALKENVEHTIYWHHAKWIRDSEFTLDIIYNKFKKNIGGDGKLFETYQTVKTLIKSLNTISEDYFEDEPLFITSPHNTPNETELYKLENALDVPRYKRYSTKESINEYSKVILPNAKNNLTRTAVITADRLISALSHEELTQHLEEKTLDNLIEKAFIKDRGLSLAIQDCLDEFNKKDPDSKRNQDQARAANDLAEEEVHVGVLSGAAGCGKTKIALEWAAKTSVKKIIWICPRVQVCQGLVNDLTSADYLPNVKIEMNTGEFKTLYQSGKKWETPEKEVFSGDIVITTIDQVINSIITHRSVTGLVTYMNAHVVFDEYHEYINLPALTLLFAELVECKKLQENNAKALLVSATPNYYFVEKLLGINSQDIIGIESFNQNLYQIKFEPFDEGKVNGNNPLYQSQPENTFVISNTAITAQQSFIVNQATENAILFHGKFKKSDKQDLFEKVFDCFKASGNHQYDVLRSGPIVQASLNISCDKMITEFTHAENWLQRLGRLDRFGKNSELNLYITAIPETLVQGKQSGKCARFLNSLHSLQSAKAWYSFLQAELTEEPVTLNQLYALYQRFYENSSHCAAVEEDLKKSLEKSIGILNRKILDPVSYPPKKQPKDNKVKIPKQSLRGDSRFVQMAVWNMGHGKEAFPNKYAYDENDAQGNLSIAVENIGGYGDNDKDLLAFMVKKHHSIKETEKYGVTSKTKYKNKIYINKSREPETPIYLSYTPDDLKIVEAEPHAYAIYYAIGINQAIGAMAFDKFPTVDE